MREMKHSGSPTVGYIPANWEFGKLKHYYDFQTGFTPDTHNESYYASDEGGYDWMTIGDMNPSQKIPAHTTTQISEAYIKKYRPKISPSGSLLYSFKLSVGQVAFADRDIYTNEAIASFLPSENNNLKFLKYSSYMIEDNANENIYGAKILNQDLIRNAYIVFPPLEEQAAIVEFLDKRCSLINEAISRQKEAIEKLEEYRVNTFTFATTKGLDENTPLKDTGLNWIPKIPEKWDVIKITHLIDQDHPYAIGDGDHGIIKNSMYQEKGIPYIRVQNLGWGTDMNLDNVVYISEELNDMIKNSTLRPNDVLFAKTGATIGKTAIVPESLPISNTTSHVGKLTIANKYNPKYIFYVLSSKTGYDQFWQYASMKATRPELSIEDIKQLIIPIPLNRNEQDEIVSFLDQVSANVEIVKKTHRDIIEKLEEYKKSLIYNAVTGKIDCRNA